MSYDASIVTMELLSRARRSNYVTTPSVITNKSSLPLEPISQLRWFISPVTIQWNAPTRKVKSYQIRIKQDGIDLPLFITYRTIYSIPSLNPNSLCVISVSAIYDNGTSAEISTPVFWAPPVGMTTLCSHLLMKNGLTFESAFECVFYNALRRNVSRPNRWKWMVMVAGSWNWIHGDSSARIQGSWLGWNWDLRPATRIQTNGEKIGWLSLAIQYLDSLLFQSLPLVSISTAQANSLKARGNWATWEKRVNDWCQLPFPIDPSIPNSWSEPTGIAYENEIDQMMEIRYQINSTDRTNAWFWSTSSAIPWIWLAMEWCRCASIPPIDQLYLMLDLLHGCELAHCQVAQWPVRDSPMAWIRQQRAYLMVPSMMGTSVIGSQWSSDSMSMKNTYLSPRTLYGVIFRSIMTKWFGESFTRYPLVYRFLTDSTPFSESTIQSSLYGTFTISSGITLEYTSWNDYLMAASQADTQCGDYLMSSIQPTLTIGTSIVSSYTNCISSKESISPFNPPVSKPSPVVPVPVVPVPVVPVIPTPVAPTPIVPPNSVEPYLISVNYLSSHPPAVIQTLLTQAITFIQSVIVQTHGKRLPSVSTAYDMIVDIDIRSLDPSILASSRPTVVNTTATPMVPLRQLVTLNSNSFTFVTTTQSKLNDQWVSALVPILIHEMLHGIGLASYEIGTKVVGWDLLLDKTKTWYTGNGAPSYAIQAYQGLVGLQVQRIPVENSFGEGTAYSHWEEGIKDGFMVEKRYYDYGNGPVYHPALPYEIMSGVAGSSYYFSSITAGALKDRGYVVNLTSSSIVPYPSRLLT